MRSPTSQEKFDGLCAATLAQQASSPTAWSFPFFKKLSDRDTCERLRGSKIDNMEPANFPQKVEGLESKSPTRQYNRDEWTKELLFLYSEFVSA